MLKKFGKFLEICNKFAGNHVNEKGNVPRCGVVPTFSDLEVVALSITAEALSIDRENYLFKRLNDALTRKRSQDYRTPKYFHAKNTSRQYNPIVLR